MAAFIADRSQLPASVTLARVGKAWHEALAEYLILYPSHTLAVVAKHFGVTVSWLSLVKNSDAFQEYYQARRREHFDDVSQSLAESKVHDKLNTLAELAVDALTEKVAAHTEGADPTAELSIDSLGECANIALKSLGFGQKQALPTGPVVNQTFIFNGDVQALNEARNRLRAVREHVIDPNVLPSQENPIDPEGAPEPATPARISPTS